MGRTRHHQTSGRALLGVTLALLALPARAQPRSKPRAPTADRLEQQALAVQETVFLRLIRRFRRNAGDPSYYRIFFLALPDGGWNVEKPDARDPDWRLLQRLWKRGLPVRNGSDNGHPAENIPGLEAFDRQTRANGVVLYISRMRWAGPHPVSLQAGYHSGYTYWIFNDYTLTWKGGRWRFTHIHEDEGRELE
jgi:hypothetical protein